MADLHKVGGRTPQAVIYKSESHKLHQAFPVKDGDTIVQGQPVKLNTDGTISPYTGDEGEVYLGIAVNYSKYHAYPATAVGGRPERGLSGSGSGRGRRSRLRDQCDAARGKGCGRAGVLALVHEPRPEDGHRNGR